MFKANKEKLLEDLKTINADHVKQENIEEIKDLLADKTIEQT